MITIEDAAKLEEQVKGRTITDLLIAQDDTSVEFTLDNGNLLIVSGELIPFLDISPTLDVELQRNEKV